MANMNPNGNGAGSRTPDAVLCDCNLLIKDEKNAAQSRKAGNDTRKKSKEEARRYKICCLTKAEETHDVYLDLDNCTALEASKSAEIIQKNIDGYIKKNDDLEKLIKESSKLIGEIKKKLEELHNAACTMSNCISNRLPGELPPPAGVEAIETTIGHIKSKSSLADETGGKAFDSVVTIAGIQTFANIDSLKNFGQQLLDAAKGFKTNIDENIKKSAEDVKTAQSELTKTLEELTAARFNLYTECVSVDALGLISEFICSGECDDNKKIEDFCDKISQNFGDDGCGPNGTLRKQGKNTRDRN